jgi:hypothetical protein
MIIVHETIFPPFKSRRRFTLNALDSRSVAVIALQILPEPQYISETHFYNNHDFLCVSDGTYPFEQRNTAAIEAETLPI